MSDELAEKVKERKQLIRQWLQLQTTMKILNDTFVAMSDEADEVGAQLAVLNKCICLKVGAIPKKK